MDIQWIYPLPAWLEAAISFSLFLSTNPETPRDPMRLHETLQAKESQPERNKLEHTNKQKRGKLIGH